MPRLSIRRAWMMLSDPPGRVLLLYVVVGLALWAIPLLNVLHAEASAVVALVAFFAAGLSSLALFERGEGFGRVLARQEALLLAPWLLLTATLPWAPNCGYGQGVLFYLLFPVVSVVVAVALAYALGGTRLRRKRTAFVGVGLAVALLAPLYDLALHPQFYVYNHVFGGVLGPIYDEELVIRPGLLAFRAMTLLWATLCWLAGRRLRGARGWRLQAGLAVTALLLGGGYLLADRLGVNTTHRAIARALDGLHRTAHFDIYYDPASLDGDALRLLAEDHEYRYAQLAARLDARVPARIASYLYPDADTRARLTGARYTNVAPVWLPRPQTHVLLEAYPHVFAHELAHVFSREFGLPGIRASLAVGLVEGLAVALEPPDGLPTPHEQVSAAATARFLRGRDDPTLAEALAPRLSPLGFWTGRGAVSYTTMGSFVRYLLDAYGPDRLKRVYARADFEAVYGRPVAALAAEWQTYVEALPAVDRATGSLMRRRFSVPSLFEKPCPHYVPPQRRRHRRGEAALAAGDTARALALFESALAPQPAYEPALAAWAQLRLAEGAAAEVAARLDTAARERTSPALAVLLGDAYGLLERPDAARARYEAALRGLPGYAHEQAALLVMRKSLAGYPDVLRILTAGAPAEARARRLDAYREALPAAGVLAALLRAAAGRFDVAEQDLSEIPMPDDPRLPPGRREILRRQRLAWLAETSYRAGAPDRAAAYAHEAARAAQRAGDFNTAARWTDFAARMAWTQRYGPARLDASG